MRDPAPPTKPLPLGPASPRPTEQKNYVKNRAPEVKGKIVTLPDGKLRTNIPENEGH